MITIIISKKIKASTKDQIKRAFKHLLGITLNMEDTHSLDNNGYFAVSYDDVYRGASEWYVFKNKEDAEKYAFKNIENDFDYHEFLLEEDFEDFYEISMGSFLDDMVNEYIKTLTNEQILEQSDLEWEYNNNIKELQKLLSDEEIKELELIILFRDLQNKLQRDFNFTKDEMYEIESLFGENEDLINTFGKEKIEKKKHSELLDKFEEDPAHFIYYNNLNAINLLEREDIEINKYYAIPEIFKKYELSYFITKGKDTDEEIITDPETNNTFITYSIR